MKEEKISQMMNELFTKNVTKKFSSGGTYNSTIIDKEYKIVVEQIIRGFLLESRDEKMGVLEAKLFVYEQIIAKSNFAPMLETIIENEYLTAIKAQ